MKPISLAILFYLFLNLAWGQPYEYIPAGKNGWLFHKHEFGLSPEYSPSSTTKALEHIISVAKLFEQQGIKLVIALTPSKTGLYGNQLPDGFALSDNLSQRYEQAILKLQENNITVVDLKSAFLVSADLEADFPLYQRLDHHWSSKGALLAAATVATTIQTEFPDIYGSMPVAEYAMQETGQAQYKDSSLIKLLSEEEKKDLEAQGYVPEQYKQFEFTLTSEAGGLFDAPTPEIVLVGSSFSDGNKNSTWPFHDALQYSLSRDVLNMAQAGQGPFEPLSNYVQSEAYITTPPKIIIWEVWELFLEAFGQSNIPPEWILHTSANIQGDCHEAGLDLTQFQSNGSFDVQTGRLENATDETYIEILLNTDTTLNDYLSVQASLEGATSQGLKVEILGDSWQRSQTMSINGSTEQALQIALFPEAGMSPRALRLYPGASTSFTLHQSRICTLPAYVAETITRPLDFKEANLSTHETTQSLFVRGFRGVEKKGRWGLGPASEVSFWLDEPRTLTLNLIFSNPIAEQNLELRFNGQIVDTLEDLKKDTLIEKTYTFQGQSGINHFSVNYSHWNGLNEQFFTQETLPFTVYFKEFSFNPIDASAASPALTELNLATSDPEAFVLTGLSGIEANGRWALGPDSTIAFETPQPQQLTFWLAFSNPIQGQSIELRLNDQVIDTLSELNQGAIEKTYTLNTQAGQNNLGFYYKDWNGLNTTFAASDTRPMAIYISRLEFHQTLDATPQAATETLPPIDISEANLMANNLPETLAVSGLASIEHEQYRWALGPESNFEFRSDNAQAFEVNMSFINPIEGQSLIVIFNGAVLQELGPLHQSTEMQLKFYINAIPGLNHLDIRYSEWNGKNITFAPDDKRPMAVLFKLLEIRAPL